MRLILSIYNPFPEIPILKVYSCVRQGIDLLYPIELGSDIFIMKWNKSKGWHCNGIDEEDIITAIGEYIEEREPPEMFWEKE